MVLHMAMHMVQHRLLHMMPHMALHVVLYVLMHGAIYYPQENFAIAALRLLQLLRVWTPRTTMLPTTKAFGNVRWTQKL